jgi:hypothetical protein
MNTTLTIETVYTEGSVWYEVVINRFGCDNSLGMYERREDAVNELLRRAANYKNVYIVY